MFHATEKKSDERKILSSTQNKNLDQIARVSALEKVSYAANDDGVWNGESKSSEYCRGEEHFDVLCEWNVNKWKF